MELAVPSSEMVVKKSISIPIVDHKSDEAAYSLLLLVLLVKRFDRVRGEAKRSRKLSLSSYHGSHVEVTLPSHVTSNITCYLNIRTVISAPQEVCLCFFWPIHTPGTDYNWGYFLGKIFGIRACF